RRLRRLERNGVRTQALEVLVNEKLIDDDFSASASSLEATFVKSSLRAAGALNRAQAIDRTKGAK
ncbi:MAG: hypothetical protein IKK39_11595, partial [Thermoguttaceae bacterium]|nr:hypothetical protein [Thermoguttaceae bacterium]